MSGIENAARWGPEAALERTDRKQFDGYQFSKNITRLKIIGESALRTAGAD